MTGLDGLLLVDKPGGITSHDAVDLVRRSLATKKVGHAGTLDPMATGLLVLGVGRGTRLLRFFGELTKMYEGTMTLGIETDTLDADGVVTRESTLEGVTEDRVREACEALVGVSMQRPPAYSAVKVGGRTSYEAARKGEVLDTPAREIRVEQFDVVAYEPPSVGFVVACGGGTYVRALAADVGGSLGVGAHLSRLRRTSIGPFSVGDAVPPDDPGRPLSLERGLAHLPHLDLEADEAVAVSHGRILGPAGIDGPYAVFSPEGRVLGVYRDEGTKARPEVILAPA